MVSISAASVHEAEAVARVYVETWRSAYAGLLPDRTLVEMSDRQQTRMWSAMIQRRARSEAVLVARHRRHGIVGMGSCGPARAGALAHEGEVFTLYVLQDHQGKGIGKRLLGSLFQRLREAGMGSALIWVLADNPARFFYEAMGGKRVAERRERLWGTTLPEAGYGWADLNQALALLESRQDGP